MAQFVGLQRPSAPCWQLAVSQKVARRLQFRPCSRPKATVGATKYDLGSAEVEQARSDTKRVEALEKKVEQLLQRMDRDDADDQAATQKAKELNARLKELEGQLAALEEETESRAMAVMQALQESADRVEQLMDEDEENNLDDVLSNITELMSRGYLEAVYRLRDRLMLTEWQLNQKPIATKQGIAQFEAWCAANKADISFETLTALYEKPTRLEVIADPHLRMQARACIHQAQQQKKLQVYDTCTAEAIRLAAQYGHADLISSVLPKDGLLAALKTAVVPAARALVPGSGMAAMGAAGVTIAAAAAVGVGMAVDRKRRQSKGDEAEVQA